MQPLLLFSSRGPVAQLGARFHGMEEVVGSNPTRSTKPQSPSLIRALRCSPPNSVMASPNIG
jgi:hypothetical protein